MADPYLDKVDALIREGVYRPSDLARRLGLPYEAILLTVGNGLNKGWWTLARTGATLRNP